MILKLYSATALIFCLAFLNAPAQNGISPGLAKELEYSLFDLQILNRATGISAAVYIPGKGVWKGVSGRSHASVPLDTNMLFGMGSLTKTFVAAEVLKLVDAGHISLDDTIGAYLPPIEHVNPAITIRQLLGMKSGVADYMNPTSGWTDSMANNPSRIWGIREVLDTFLVEPVALPGEKFLYNNTNYSLLALINEAKKNDSLHKALRNDLFMPLGLKNTYMIVEKFPNTIVHSWLMEPTGPKDMYNVPKEAIWTSVAPARGLLSTPEDIVRFGYNLYSGNVISQASLKEMLTFTDINGSFTGYGLGTMRFTDKGRTYWGHNGLIDGFLTIMMYDPVDSVCVALMVNQWSSINIVNLGKIFMNTVLTFKTTSVSDSDEQENISITPNPAFNEITFSNTTGNCSLKIINNLGEIVYSGMLDAPRTTINTSGFASGMYVAIISSTSGTITKKILIQR